MAQGSLSLREYLDTAVALATDAGAFVLSHYQRGIDVELKSDRSPVTAADLGAERLIRAGLAAHGDPRVVVADPNAPYFGAVIDDTSIVPLGSAIVFPTRFADWLSANVPSGSR